MKKTIFITLFLMIILVANISLASYSTVTMDVVEEPICTVKLTENSNFEKKLVSKNLNNKEVTIQLQVKNEEISSKPTGEVMLVIDNSNSMTEVTPSGKTRKELVFESAKTLVTNLLQDNTSLKVGIVSFSTNTDIAKEGTIEDAKIESALSTDINTLTNAISNIETDGARTDLQSGLLLASQQFTSEANNKYMIVLTDGVPNVAINYDRTYYSDDVIAKTKQQLININTSNINIITMLTGISNPDYVPAGVDKTFGTIISEIFGTTSNPTAGQFYYITDDKIEKTITDDIYKSLVPESKSLKNIKVVDYFPKEIIDNFDFAYVKEANIGTISAEVDKTNNSITWTIPELKDGETAIVQYKLKLKENFDSKIVGKILNTNKKVDITYTNLDGVEQSKTTDISPKIKLTEPPAVLPKAGITTLIILSGLIVAGFLVVSATKLTIINNKMK